MTDTIQEDVPEVEILEKKDNLIEIGNDEEVEPPEDDPRAAIYKKHDEQRAAEKNTEDPAPEQKPDEEITVKVNGKTRQVLRSKVEEAGGVDIYQKNAAASELLRQANSELQRVREYEAQVLARDAENKRIENARAASRPTEPSNQDAQKELAANYHNAIFEGDLDTANSLLIKMTALNATANPDDIARKISAETRVALAEERTKAQQENFENERVAVVDKFADVYPDIAEDHELFTLTDIKTLEIHQEHPDWGPKAIIEEAAKRVRKWSADRSSSKDKLAAKRSQIVVKGGSARTVSRPEQKPQTRSEYVEQLRKSRGLVE